MHIIPNTLIYWTNIKESIFSGLYFHAILSILISHACAKAKILYNMVATDNKRHFHRYKFIRRICFYIPKPVKTAAFTLKQNSMLYLCVCVSCRNKWRRWRKRRRGWRSRWLRWWLKTNGWLNLYRKRVKRWMNCVNSWRTMTRTNSLSQ